DEIVIQGLHREILLLGELVRIVSGELEFGRMKSTNQGSDVEHLNPEGIFGAKLESAPVRINKHQFDVGFFRYDLIEPTAIKVVAPETLIQFLGLLVGDNVEVNAVEVLKRREHISIEAGGAGVGEIVLSLGPPIGECAARRPRRKRVDPAIVAAG